MDVRRSWTSLHTPGQQRFFFFKSFFFCSPGNVYQVDLRRSSRDHRNHRGGEELSLHLWAADDFLQLHEATSEIKKNRGLRYVTVCSDVLITSFFLSLLSLRLIAVRRSTLEMKSFRSIIRQWSVCLHFYTLFTVLRVLPTSRWHCRHICK